MTQAVLPSESSTINRRLAAIAFADIAGFSRLMAIDEIETLRRWKALRSEIIEPHIARHRGRVAEIAGDAVLAEFPSVVNAVRWAADVQRAQRGARDEKDPRNVGEHRSC
jgi:adenylate cyclase